MTNKTTKLIEEIIVRFDSEKEMNEGPACVSEQWLIRAMQGVAQSAREEERERIKKKYGHYNDGCGCCSTVEDLEAVLRDEKSNQQQS